MATNLNISENQERVPLRVGGGGLLRTITPDNGSPYYVGARAYVTQTAGGAIVTVIDKDGTTTATILNGTNGQNGVSISDISLTGSSGLVDTYTITYSNGDTDTFTVTNGQDGADGNDGYSPTATVTKSGDTATITITDINGTTTATVKDGMQANVFVAEFNVTTYADVKDAYDNDAILICTVDDSGNTMTLQLVYFDATNEIFFFAFPTSDGWYWTQLSNADGWDDGQFYFASTDVATQLADGLMSALDKQKLDGLSKRNIWYGECTTNSSSSPKVVTTSSGDFSLTAGNMLVVKFANTNQLSSASLQVDGGASKSAYAMDGTSDISYRWGSSEVVMFAYDGTKFILLEQGKASTTQYGITKLNNTTSSTSTSEAATANAVKSAYDNGGVQSVNGSTGAVTLSIHNVPSGGSSGQVLSKASGTDYDLAWSTPSSGSVTDVTVDGVSVVTGGVASVDLTGKQDELVSGTNIRTINGTSILGSGDISVAAGGTPIPTADTVAEFDSSACMNSSDMSAQDIEDFLADINTQGTPSEYKKLLWTNASPSSSFSAQTILSDVDLTEYDEFEIEVRNYITGDIYNICRFENASQRQIWVFDTSNFTGSTIPVQLSRIINISSSGMAISNGYSKPYNSTSAPTNNSNICLPIKIYGIKYEKVAPIQVNASDYVVDQGTVTYSGVDWVYRKWESGIAECWGKSTASKSFGNGYTNMTTNLPTLFIQGFEPIVVNSGGVQGLANSSAAYIKANWTTDHWALDAYMYNANPSTGSSAWYYVHAIGKWK